MDRLNCHGLDTALRAIASVYFPKSLYSRDKGNGQLRSLCQMEFIPSTKICRHCIISAAVDNTDI